MIAADIVLTDQGGEALHQSERKGAARTARQGFCRNAGNG
jgi:hypothetical protein